jgi:hypothetical protein
MLFADSAPGTNGIVKDVDQHGFSYLNANEPQRRRVAEKGEEESYDELLHKSSF